jgi:hypothetical protein
MPLDKEKLRAAAHRAAAGAIMRAIDRYNTDNESQVDVVDDGKEIEVDGGGVHGYFTLAITITDAPAAAQPAAATEATKGTPPDDTRRSDNP